MVRDAEIFDSETMESDSDVDEKGAAKVLPWKKIAVVLIILAGAVCLVAGLLCAVLQSQKAAACDRTATITALNASLQGRLVALTPGAHPAWSPWYYWNLGALTELPTYGVSPQEDADIQAVVTHAKSCGMTVNTKVHGHSYFGASAARADLVVSMSEHYNGVEIIPGPYKDTCGTARASAMRVGGGASWIEVYRALGPNYTSVGGACDSVSAAGGWLLSNGLGLQSQRKYGLGIDNVVELQVVLASGEHVKADACTNPDLFTALKGGGGGFGIVTSAVYMLHPGGPIQEFRLGFDRSKFQTSGNEWNDQYWDLVVNHTFVEDRWALWPAQHIRLDEFGASDKFIIWMYFEGNLEDALASKVYRDFEAWSRLAPVEARINIHRGFATFQQYKVEERIVSAEMSGVRNYKNPGVNGNFPYYGNRLIPRDFILNEPLKARKMFQSMEGYTCDNFYHMGGAISRLGRRQQEVASPAIRESAWQIGLCDLSKLEELREMFNDASGYRSGTGHNHAGWTEPNWRASVWGDDNYARLLELKNKYDPDRVFKCRHCVGDDEL